MAFENYDYTAIKRFLHLVTFDTQSDETSSSVPSTPGQKILGDYLVGELKKLGLQDATMDENGYVFATLPANTTKTVPIIGLLAHIDTSPENSGRNVQPLLHENVQTTTLQLPSGKTIDLSQQPDYDQNICGKDLITSDGTTLLGADDKAGIAEILDALAYLQQHPEVLHGTLKIGFTPDEEIGKGPRHFDVKKFGADFAYTIDGGEVGDVGFENFSAEKVTITFTGKAIHPGYAKNILVNAIKLASTFISLLPKNSLSPETTENKEGFVHPIDIKGTVEEVQLVFVNRDFETAKLGEYRQQLHDLCEQATQQYPGSRYELIYELQYENMKPILDKEPKVTQLVLEAMKRVGVTPLINPTRGGTDGAQLSYKGLPCPNIFAGGRNFHSKEECIVIDDMKLAVQTIVALVRLWEERA
jgi:tripeptide aminopeptidase